jgi:hypothetical protein
VSASDSGKYFIEIEILSGNSPLPIGTKCYGHGQFDKMPSFDSITIAPIFSNDYNDNLTSTLQSIFKQIEFPDKTIKIGEEFFVTNALEIPAGDDTIPFKIVTTYKLLKIKDNIAKFTIRLTYEMNPSCNSYASLNGSGSGYLNFDMINKCYKEYGIKSNTSLKLKRDNFTVQTNTTSTATLFYKVKRQ